MIKDINLVRTNILAASISTTDLQCSLRPNTATVRIMLTESSDRHKGGGSHLSEMT